MTLQVAVLELPARFARQAEAAADAQRLLRLGPCDLALLSECALTGYVSPAGDFDLSRFAEPLASSSQLDALRSLAEDARCHVAGPVVEAGEGTAYNTFAVVSPAGDLVVTYRKRHPWYPETWATPGEAPHPTFVVGDLTLTIAICFDIHFVREDGADQLAASDALLFPSAWVDEGPADARAEILGRIAHRTGAAIVNANWGRGVPRVQGQGGSRVVFPDGRVRIIDPGLGPRRLDVELGARA